jgi:hypothetical protein
LLSSEKHKASGGVGAEIMIGGIGRIDEELFDKSEYKETRPSAWLSSDD